jgi:phenylacetate-coenzyme A ligase PaaK-like adenylate-forming protein
MTTAPAGLATAPGWHERSARLFWYAHPAHPGPQYAALIESQWWSRDRIEALQVSRLQRLVRIALQVPFYRDRFRAAGVDADVIRTLDDVRKLPILERPDLQRLGIAGLKVPGAWGMRASSSGSTGRAVHFLWPLEQMRWLDAGEARARVWLGSDVGTRRLEVRCRPVGRLQAISATLLNTAAFHAPVVADRAEVRRLAQALERRPPTLIWGVSNALYVLAVALLEEGRSVRAGACWSGGNHLHPHYRQAFERAFACEVYERYASMETGLVAHECVEARSLHVPAEGLIVEILNQDGEEVAAHETGDVVVTCLHNTATPLIRYRLGDRAEAPDGRACACGRGLPVFGRVAGRANDFLRTAEGTLVSPGEAVAAARIGHDSIIDFQVVQANDRRLRILVVQRESATEQADRERLVETFARIVHPPERPSIERVDHIALTPGGKLRTLVVER